MTTSIERLEDAGRATWTPDEVTEIGGWLVAANGGFTRRVNSATARGPVVVDTPTHVSIAEWLAARDAAFVVRVTPLLPAEAVDAARRVWGLTAIDPTLVMTKGVDVVASPPDISVVDLLEPAFGDELFVWNEREPRHRPQWERIMRRLGEAGVGVWIPGVAAGVVGVADGIACVYSVAVAPDHRRQGAASRIMAGAEAWAAEREADTLSLQVTGVNAPAIGLYEGLGYRTAYTYHYLVPSSGTGGDA